MRKVLSFLDYVKAAFWQKINVPGLGALPLNGLACLGLFALGFGHPAFWLLGLGLESAYLTLLAGSARFQRVVQGRDLVKEAEQREQHRIRLLDSLSTSARKRYNKLMQQAYAVVPAGDSSVGDLLRDNLAGMLWTFLRLLASQEKVQGILDNANRSDAELELAELEKRIADAPADSALQRSLTASVEILRKRLANLDRAKESTLVLSAELERIERQITLLREEAAVGQSPEALTSHLDTVSRSLEDTSRWLNDHADLLGSESEPPPLPSGNSISQ